MSIGGSSKEEIGGGTISGILENARYESQIGKYSNTINYRDIEVKPRRGGRHSVI